MGKSQEHLADELLSAFADQETSPAEAEAVRQHAASCLVCHQRLAAFTALDQRLAAPAAIGCAAARPLLSAELDGELAPDLADTLREHLVACGPCQEARASWVALAETLRALPLERPSARVDAAIERLAAGRRLAFPLPSLPSLAVRVAVAAGLVVALLSGSVLLPGGGDQAAIPGPNGAIVASLQTIALDPRTNTLYVLKPDDGVVLVRDAASDEQLASVAVGGRPSAIALDPSKNAVYVLDSRSSALVQIDTTTHAIVATQQLSLAGAPVSLQVDPAQGRVLVASQTNGNGGQLAVVDTGSSTLTVDSVRTVDVAPGLVLVDPDSGRTFVVGAQATLVLDSKTLARVATLPGAVSAASNGGVTAFLSGTGKTNVFFYGVSADAVALPGAPLSIVPGPGRDFAALVDVGGKSRVVELGTGGIVRSRDVAATARQLAFDKDAQRYTLVADSGDVVDTLSGALSSIATPTPAASAAAPSASPSAAPSAQPSASPSAAPGAPASAAPVALVPPVPGAQLAWSDTWFIDLGKWQPVRVVAAGTGVWFLDPSGSIVALDPATGVANKIVQLPAGTTPAFVASNGGYLYVLDDDPGNLYAVQLGSGRVTTDLMPFGRSVTGMTATPDGHAWFAASTTGALVDFDPSSRLFRNVDLGVPVGLAGISSDTGGRLWFAYPAAGGVAVASFDPRARQIHALLLPGLTGVRSVFADNAADVWLSAPDGRWVGISGDRVVASLAGLPGTAERFALGPDGVAWLLRGDRTETRLGRATGALETVLPGGITDVAGDGQARFWLAAPYQNRVYLLVHSVTAP